MGMIFEDPEDHEGYAARRLPDGTVTSTWTQDTAAFDAYVGACTCGWTGSHQHPPTEAGRTGAEDQWEHAHARPLLAAATSARVTELVHNLREEMAGLADDRPLAAAPSPSDSPPGPSTSCNPQPPPSDSTDSTPWATGDGIEDSRLAVPGSARC